MLINSMTLNKNMMSAILLGGNRTQGAALKLQIEPRDRKNRFERTATADSKLLLLAPEPFRSNVSRDASNGPGIAVELSFFIVQCHRLVSNLRFIHVVIRSCFSNFVFATFLSPNYPQSCSVSSNIEFPYP